MSPILNDKSMILFFKVFRMLRTGAQFSSIFSREGDLLQDFQDAPQGSAILNEEVDERITAMTTTMLLERRSRRNVEDAPDSSANFEYDHQNYSNARHVLSPASSRLFFRRANISHPISLKNRALALSILKISWSL